MGTETIQELEITSEAIIRSQIAFEGKYFVVQSKTLQDFSREWDKQEHKLILAQITKATINKSNFHIIPFIEGHRVHIFR